jgi:uncharacterized protein YjbI with pentapeptide repeats
MGRRGLLVKLVRWPRTSPQTGKSLDPFDVEGLEKSLGDSATRVSTIWISYLLFGLYLLVSAGTATNKQLLLAEPLKLPALGSDVPLVSFFIISPILFFLLHIYVLLQVLLLGRTAQAYNRALDRALTIPSQNAFFRERLANTIFAQIFAGSPRERDGWVGAMLKGITWFTLVGAPICVMLSFQLSFLPYHSSGVTWIHRALVYAEIAVAFAFWPLVIDPRKGLYLSRLALPFWQMIRLPNSLLGARGLSLRQRRSTQRHAVVLAACASIIAISTFAISFPGEWHKNVLTLKPGDYVDCSGALFRPFDRLILKDVSVLDPKGLKDLNDDVERGQPLYEGARSKDMSGRDFNCGEFETVDFRRADLTGSFFVGSNLKKARFDGAILIGAFFDRSQFRETVIKDANFRGAHLRRADLNQATLKSVDLSLADLQGADFTSARISTLVEFGENASLQGANLIDLRAIDGAQLKLRGAHLEGASLQNAVLREADLTNAKLIGADLDYADLQGANLSGANLAAAFLHRTRLQTATLSDGTKFDRTVIKEAFLWGIKNADCSKSFVIKPDLDSPTELPGARSDGMRTCVDNSATHTFDEAAFAEAVADQACVKDGPSSLETPEQRDASILNENKSAVVAGLILNALYPQNQPDKKSPEQSLKYRKALAGKLSRCMPEISREDLQRLTTELGGGSPNAKQKK